MKNIHETLHPKNDRNLPLCDTDARISTWDNCFGLAKGWGAQNSYYLGSLGEFKNGILIRGVDPWFNGAIYYYSDFSFSPDDSTASFSGSVLQPDGTHFIGKIKQRFYVYGVATKISGRLANKGSKKYRKTRRKFTQDHFWFDKSILSNHEYVRYWTRSQLPDCERVHTGEACFGQIGSGINLYIGEQVASIPQGMGVSLSPDGSIYLGEFIAGKRHGFGALHREGEYYYGNFEDNYFSGKGFLSRKKTNGDIFNSSGEYVNGKPHGYHSNWGYIASTKKATSTPDVWWCYGVRNNKGACVEQPSTQPRQEFAQPIIRNAEDENLVPASSGSGFFVSTQGHVITNHHVVAGCQTVEAVRSGNKYDAQIVAKDNINDLALIKIDKKIDNPLSVSQMNPELLQDIYVAGYPFGKALGDSIKVTKGIVSSLSGLNNNYSNIQIDAAIQPGNSGGPILDANGNVVGVAVAKLDLKGVVEQYGVVPENTNFGIKSTAVRNLAEANGVRLIQASTQKLAGSELGRKITDGTVYLSCLMTIAQINKLQSSKVVFKHLQN